MKYDKKLYDISPCSSLGEFIEKIYTWYGDSTAFRDYKNYWSYSDLYHMIKKLLPYFINNDTNYYCIKIVSPIYFFVAFSAIIISGKIALLGSENQSEGELIENVTEEDIIHIISENQTCAFPKKVTDNMPSIIVRSSGTTSIAKGVMLSQKNLLSDTISGMQMYEYPKNAVYYNVLPYSHLFGIVADMLGPLYSGATICFSQNKMNFFNDLQFFKPTHMNLPPAMVYTIERMLLKTNDKKISTGGSLTKIMCAGATISQSTIKNMADWGVSVYPAYGLTECSPCVSMNSELFSKPGSVGKILPCCKVRIVDGEVAVCGENVMLGYWNNSQSTLDIIRDGWLYTGDLGFLDDDGFLFLTGRKSNIIVFEDGKKIIPEIIEADLNAIDCIEECIVTKTQSKEHVMIIVTVVTHCTDSTKLLQQVEHCIIKHEISDKVAEIILTDQDLPKNKLGKVIRN